MAFIGKLVELLAVFPYFSDTSFAPCHIYIITDHIYGVGKGIFGAVCMEYLLFVFPHLGYLVCAVVLIACGIYIFAYHEYGVGGAIFRANGKCKEFATFFPHLGNVVVFPCGIYVATRYEYGKGFGIFRAVCKVGGTFVFPKFGYIFCAIVLKACSIYLVIRYEYGIGGGIFRTIGKFV